MSKIPEKNSSQWVKNERIIAKNSALRQARDISEGFKPSSGITTGGDITDSYKQGYDQIDWSKRDDKPKSYRLKVNGKYVDEE